MNIRNAVRVFAFKEDKVACIRYKNTTKDYYDIPGGKIETGETEVQTCIREFKEETGMNVDNLDYIGVIKTIYPDKNKVFNLKVYIGNNVIGSPKELEENYSYWMPISELIEKDKRFAITHLLDKDLIKYFDTKGFDITFICDENHNIINVSVNEPGEKELKNKYSLTRKNNQNMF